jgi:hypothetical protein
MSDADKTVRMLTNLDRKAVEAKLAEVRQAAQSAKLQELASLFSGVEGLPRAQIEPRVQKAQQLLAGKAQYQRMAADLELVEMNLKNLK